MRMGYVYILECSDGSYYTGSTIDLENRLNQHNEGKGANHTKKRLPIKLVFVQNFTSIEEAFKREKQIQGWSRKKKEALIKNNFEKLHQLSNCKNESNSKNHSRSLSGVEMTVEDTEASTSLSHRYYSNGKLLLTGEYFVLDGAKSLAVPTTCGQDLTVEAIEENQLVWKSFTNTGKCWLEAIFDLPKLRLVSADFEASVDDGNDTLAENLRTILIETQKLNPAFLKSDKGFLVKTNLTFPKNWGLGTSSTLINNLATWAEVNPYSLLENTFGGSGYDIACAKHNTPILYAKVGKIPLIEKVEFNPSFKEQLYFVYLNKKQNSREGIQRYRSIKGGLAREIQQISSLTDAFLKCNTIADFDKIMFEHEQLVSKTIQLKTVQDKYFSDYFGQTKSLGAWGGDFILASGNEDTPNYFKQKGFETVIPYQDLII